MYKINLAQQLIFNCYDPKIIWFASQKYMLYNKLSEIRLY